MQDGEIKILIADPQRLSRDLLVGLFSQDDGFVVVGEAGDGDTAIEQVRRLRPDVVIIDISLRSVDGIEVTRRITRTTSPTRIVLLASADEISEDKALEAGAYSLARRDRMSFTDLAEIVRGAARRDPPPATAEADKPAGGIITPREREIAVLLADGYSTKEAANVLGIGVRTAETHRAAVMRKLGARNVADVVKYCIRNHLIDV